MSAPKIVYRLSSRPQARTFVQTALPNGTIVRTMDRGVFQRACAAATPAIHAAVARIHADNMQRMGMPS
jgi:3-hydroxy-3-methylglutaryl CoA synthase